MHQRKQNMLSMVFYYFSLEREEQEIRRGESTKESVRPQRVMTRISGLTIKLPLNTVLDFNDSIKMARSGAMHLIVSSSFYDQFVKYTHIPNTKVL